MLTGYSAHCMPYSMSLSRCNCPPTPCCGSSLWWTMSCPSKPPAHPLSGLVAEPRCCCVLSILPGLFVHLSYMCCLSLPAAVHWIFMKRAQYSIQNPYDKQQDHISLVLWTTSSVRLYPGVSYNCLSYSHFDKKYIVKIRASDTCSAKWLSLSDALLNN